MKRMRFNSQSWAVVFVSPRSRPHFVGSWSPKLAEMFPHEPAHRPMLFTTRQSAREWCKDQCAKCAQYPDGHEVRARRYRPARVRVTVEEV